MVPKKSAVVLSSVPEHKKAAMCLVLGKLLSGINHSASGCEFNVNESTLYV